MIEEGLEIAGVRGIETIAEAQGTEMIEEGLGIAEVQGIETIEEGRGTGEDLETGTPETEGVREGMAREAEAALIGARQSKSSLKRTGPCISPSLTGSVTL